MRETVAQEKVQVAMLPAGGPRLELLEPTEPDSVIGQFLEKRGEGLHHVALRVPDLAAAVERLSAGGARILNEPRRGAGGHEYVFVHPASTGGVLLELIQDERNLKAKIGIIGGSGLYCDARIRGARRSRPSRRLWSPSDKYVVGTLAGKRSRSWRGTDAGTASRPRS